MVVLAEFDADPVRVELAAFVRLHEPTTVVAERLRLDQDHVRYWLLRLELKRHAIRSPRFEISADRTRRSVLLQHTPEILPVRVVLESRCEPLELRSVYVSHAVCHFFRSPDLQSLSLLNRSDEVGSLQQSVGRPSVEPGDAAA